MLRCEAALRAVLVDGDGEILWQGRKRRLATRAQYEAMAVRDGGCTARGCDRPPRECDAHHDVPWGAGGHTDVDQMRCCAAGTIASCMTSSGSAARVAGDEIGRTTSSVGSSSRATPWYTDTPAWYPGPSPWRPEGSGDDGRVRAEACGR